MEALLTMVRNLVILTFFTVLADLMLPGSSFRRYLKMVYGLAVILVLLTPMADIFDQIPDLDLTLRQSQMELNQEILAVRTDDAVSASQRRLILEVYRDRVGQEVTRYLEQEGNWQVVQVAVEVVSDYDADNFGAVTRINATVSQPGSDSDPETGAGIDPVRIDPITITPSAPEPELEETLAPELAQGLADYFMLERDRVEVKVISTTGNS